MAGTPNYNWRLPLQTTAPPDVVAWLTNGLTDADATVKSQATLLAAKKAQIDYCSLSTTGFTLASGVSTKVNFATEAGTHPAWGSTSTDDITVPDTGAYQVQFTGAMTSGVGLMQASLWLDGTTLLVGQENARSASYPEPFYVALSMTWQMSAGTKVSLKALQRGLTSPSISGTLLVSRTRLT